MYDGYDVSRGMYLWEMLVMLRKVAIVAISSFVRSTYVQVRRVVCGTAQGARMSPGGCSIKSVNARHGWRNAIQWPSDGTGGGADCGSSDDAPDFPAVPIATAQPTRGLQLAHIVDSDGALLMPVRGDHRAS